MIQKYWITILGFYFIIQRIISISQSTPAIWVGSDEYQSGTITGSNSQGQLHFTYSVAFTSLPKKMLIGYSSLWAGTSGTKFKIDVFVNETQMTYGNVYYKFYSEAIVFTRMQLRYLVVSSNVPWLSVNNNRPFDYYKWVDNSCPELFSGSGTRKCELIGNFFTGTNTLLNLSNQNVMLIWPQAMTMNTIAGQPFAFQWNTTWVDDKNYKIILTLYKYTTFTNLSYSRLIYDKTFIEANQTVYLDGDVLVGKNTFSSLSLNLLFTSSNSFMIGLSFWNVSDNIPFNFTFNEITFTTSGSMTFNQIALAYWNYRFRTCPVGYTYFVQSQNLCYNQCKDYTFSVNNPKTCKDCYFYCQKCTSNSATACTQCSIDDGRKLISNKCLCTTGYFQSNQKTCGKCHYSCQNCTSTSSSSCSTCPSTRALDSNKCLCISPLIDTGQTICTNCTIEMAGCTTCSSKTICLSCNVSLNFIFDNDKCVCKTQTYFVSNQCKFCSTSIPGCSTCSSSSVCTSCKQTQFFQLSSSKCVCKIKYYNNSNTCKLCSESIIGCQTCSSSSICNSCLISNHFYLNNSKCQCQDSTYKNLTTRNCEDCNTNCIKCISSNICTQCDSLKMTPNIGLCTLCSSLIIGCDQCSQSNICDICQISLFFELNSLGLCQCMELRFLNINKCQLCEDYMTGCIKCQNNSQCKMCDSMRNFQLFNGSCHCIYKHYLINQTICLNCSTSCQCSGYYLINGICQSICGDGIYNEDFQQCDDGNIKNRDGCNSNCNIQNDFQCSLNGQLSYCSYTKPLDMKIQTVTKNPDCNCLTLVISVGPQQVDLENIDFSNLITPNIDGFINPKFIYQNGTVIIAYEYLQSFQGQNITFTLQPHKNQAFNLTPNSQASIEFKSSNNQLFLFYDQQIYDSDSKFKYLYIGAMSASYIILIFSMFTNKIVGIQIMGVIQIAFFALSNLDFLNPFMSPLAKLKIVNGFNYQYYNSKDTPNSIHSLDYSSNFSSNLNIMLILSSICLIVGLFLYFLSRICHNENKYNKLLKWSKNFFKQYFLTSTMFSLYNTAFSSAVFIRYNTQKTYFPINIFCICLANSFIIILISVLIFTNPTQFGQYKYKVKKDFVSKNYFIFSIAYKYTLGFIVGYFNSNAIITIVEFFLCIIFLMYLASNRPFVQGYHNYRGIICQLTTLTILGVGMYYRSMKQSVPIFVKGLIFQPSYIHISAIIFCIFISLLVLIYQILIFMKQFIQGKKKTNRHSMNIKNIKNVNSNVEQSQIKTENDQSIYQMQWIQQ